MEVIDCIYLLTYLHTYLHGSRVCIASASTPHFELSWFLCVAGWDHFEANEVGFKELYQLFRLVTEQVGQEPIIIDADDLLKQPGVPYL